MWVVITVFCVVVPVSTVTHNPVSIDKSGLIRSHQVFDFNGTFKYAIPVPKPQKSFIIFAESTSQSNKLGKFYLDDQVKEYYDNKAYANIFGSNDEIEAMTFKEQYTMLIQQSRHIKEVVFDEKWSIQQITTTNLAGGGSNIRNGTSNSPAGLDDLIVMTTVPGQYTVAVEEADNRKYVSYINFLTNLIIHYERPTIGLSHQNGHDFHDELLLQFEFPGVPYLTHSRSRPGLHEEIYYHDFFYCDPSNVSIDSSSFGGKLNCSEFGKDDVYGLVVFSDFSILSVGRTAETQRFVIIGKNHSFQYSLFSDADGNQLPRERWEKIEQFDSNTLIVTGSSSKLLLITFVEDAFLLSGDDLMPTPEITVANTSEITVEPNPVENVDNTTEINSTKSSADTNEEECFILKSAPSDVSPDNSHFQFEISHRPPSESDKNFSAQSIEICALKCVRILCDRICLNMTSFKCDLWN